MNDAINSPNHYTSHPSGVECFDIVEHFNFCRGGAIKYIWRAGLKGDEIEDLKKARRLIDREVERLTKERAGYIRHAEAEDEARDLEATADEIMAAATKPDDAPTGAEALQAEQEEMRARVGHLQAADLTPYTDALTAVAKDTATAAATELAGEPIDVADIKVGDRVSAWFGGSSPGRIEGVVKGSVDGYLTLNGMIIRFSSGKSGTLMSDIRKLS